MLRQRPERANARSCEQRLVVSGVFKPTTVAVYMSLRELSSSCRDPCVLAWPFLDLDVGHRELVVDELVPPLGVSLSLFRTIDLLPYDDFSL